MRVLAFGEADLKLLLLSIRAATGAVDGRNGGVGQHAVAAAAGEGEAVEDVSPEPVLDELKKEN